MPIWFVTGFMRCGTSMTMRALEAGGMDAAYNPVRDRMNEQHGDASYRPNDGGFYELHRSQYRAKDFPDAYEGMLVKFLWGGIITLPSRDPCDPYRVVLMRRDPDEISESIEGFFRIHAPKTPPQYQTRRIRAALDRTENALLARDDVSLSVFDYPSVVADPESHFRALVDTGWPFEPITASGIVQPDRYRFRMERDHDPA